MSKQSFEKTVERIKNKGGELYYIYKDGASKNIYVYTRSSIEKFSKVSAVMFSIWMLDDVGFRSNWVTFINPNIILDDLLQVFKTQRRISNNWRKTLGKFDSRP